MIPLCDPKQQYLQLQTEIDSALLEVAARGQYILGPNVRAFEQEFAEYSGCEFAVGVGSGTDALHLALRALDIGPGDEVITTPFTFVATTEAIGMVGATPVFVDIDPRTFNLDPNQLEAAITERTKVILLVHLYGQPCDMAPLLEIAEQYGLHVVEDCAQALGAKIHGRSVGTIGELGCFSFFPSKNLGCLGDGGMVVTNDQALYERIESLRRHGGRVKYHHDELGLNSRLDELQAAVLRVKLPHLENWNLQRYEKAKYYNELLSAAPGLTLPAEKNRPEDGAASHVYHQYTVQVENRDLVKQEMQELGVQCFPYYPKCLHLQAVHDDLAYAAGSFPHAERASQTCLSLPMYPELAPDEQRLIATSLVECQAAITLSNAA